MQCGVQCRREIVFLLLGAPGFSLSFGTLLRLTFIRMGRVMEDSNIIGMLSDPDLTFFVKLAVSLGSGDAVYDLSLQQVLPVAGGDLSSLSVYLDLQQIFHEIGVDLASAGSDPMAAPEAFGLKLLWPGYMEDDEKYLAILIAGILVTRYERNTEHLPKYSMHLTEVGMHLKALEAVDAALAWSLPILKTDGLRLARFLSKPDTAKYFSIFDSPCHHSDKVVSLNASSLWGDAERLWSTSEVQSFCGSDISASPSLQSQPSSSLSEIEPAMGEEETDVFLDDLTRSCAEIAIDESRYDAELEGKLMKTGSFDMAGAYGQEVERENDEMSHAPFDLNGSSGGHEQHNPMEFHDDSENSENMDPRMMEFVAGLQNLRKKKQQQQPPNRKPLEDRTGRPDVTDVYIGTLVDRLLKETNSHYSLYMENCYTHGRTSEAKKKFSSHNRVPRKSYPLAERNSVPANEGTNCKLRTNMAERPVW
ncbi:hypothetical protein BSKO_07943 [Bryopsis sp. KO-2023]|nr:hypothetical protein BSKO_07943 [Bryopsis sp. KO-2023]